MYIITIIFNTFIVGLACIVYAGPSIRLYSTWWKSLSLFYLILNSSYKDFTFIISYSLHILLNICVYLSIFLINVI